MLEEAETRDHRKLGSELDLFHMQDEAPGLVFWHPKGWAMWQQVEQYMRRVYRDNGYQEVQAPQILDRACGRSPATGRTTARTCSRRTSENRDYAIKPMNCPGHIQIYNAESAQLPRAAAALRRVRLVPSQRAVGLAARASCACAASRRTTATSSAPRSRSSTKCVALTRRCCRRSTATSASSTSSTRSRRGRPSASARTRVWDKAEHALMESLSAPGVEFTISPGEGAFYGPKIEYTLKDAIGREWQCGTMQVDFFMPERLGAEYVAEDNTPQDPGDAAPGDRRLDGALHRHPDRELRRARCRCGSRRCRSRSLNISEAQAEYAEAVAQTLKKQGFRVDSDLRNEKITYKIRELSLQKIPYILVVGDKEKLAGLDNAGGRACPRRSRPRRDARCRLSRSVLQKTLLERRNVGGRLDYLRLPGEANHRTGTLAPDQR